MCCFPSGSSPCSRANSGWSNTFPNKTSSPFALVRFQVKDNHLKLVYCQFSSKETNFSKILTPGIETSPCNYILPVIQPSRDQQLVAAWTCSTGADSLKKAHSSPISPRPAMLCTQKVMSHLSLQQAWNSPEQSQLKRHQWSWSLAEAPNHQSSLKGSEHKEVSAAELHQCKPLKQHSISLRNPITKQK